MNPHPHACVALPFSRISKGKSHGSRRGLTVRGTAGEHPCAHVSKAKRRKEHVARVFLIIYKPLAHGRCRFLTKRGALTAARSCSRPIELRASGTGRWRLQLKVPIPAGHYLIRSDAVDRLHHHQRRSAQSTLKLRV